MVKYVCATNAGDVFIQTNNKCYSVDKPGSI